MVELVELELDELELDEELDDDEELDELDVLEPSVVLDVVGGGTLGVSPSALPTNVAIWARVTSAFGQNASFDGGLHPDVTPAVARRSMSPSNTESSSSAKRSAPAPAE